MQEGQSIVGAISVKKLVWTATVMPLVTLYICWSRCADSNPTIFKTAITYPFTVIMRIGMLYTLFIYFLLFVFIKWWLDATGKATNTNRIIQIGLIGLVGYGFFVSCLDTQRVNHELAEWGVFVAAVSMIFVHMIIMKNLKKIQNSGIFIISGRSWQLKKVFYWIFRIAIVVGVGVYTGYLSISLKPVVEYIVTISTILFFWTFSLDFNDAKMDVIRMPDKLNPLSSSHTAK